MLFLALLFTYTYSSGTKLSSTWASLSHLGFQEFFFSSGFHKAPSADRLPPKDSISFCIFPVDPFLIPVCHFHRILSLGTYQKTNICISFLIFPSHDTVESQKQTNFICFLMILPTRTNKGRKGTANNRGALVLRASQI